MLFYLRCVFALLLSGVIAGAALAATPCSSLSGADKARYNTAVDEVYDAVDKEDYEGAIVAALEANKICDEDPNFPLRIAQWSHRAGNCAQALSWYDDVIQRKLDGQFDPLIEEARQEAKLNLLEVKKQCKVTTLHVDCTDPGATVTFHDQAPADCPAIFTLDFFDPDTTYIVEAIKSGRTPYQTEVKLVEGASINVNIPSMNSDTAHLRFRCQPDEGPVRIESPNGTFREMGCPVDQPIDPGSYILITPDNQRVSIELASGQTYEGSTATGGPTRSYALTITGAVLLATGLAAGGVGGFFHSESFAAAEKANDLAVDKGILSVEERTAKHDAAEEEVEDKFTIAVISYSVGGVLVATGITLLVLDLTTNSETHETSSLFAPILLPGGGGLSWTLSF